MPYRFSISGQWLNRFILWLSLFGMVLAVHLWIQKARGFDQGCLGLQKHILPDEGGCSEVNALPASHLFGVSNAAWGYVFYFSLAFLSFAKVIVPKRWGRRLHHGAEVIIATAFVYSGYLVYQMGFVSHSWCALCVISATVVLLLTLLHVAQRWSGGYQPVSPDAYGAELGLAAISAFFALSFLAGVVLFVDRLGTRPLNEGSTADEVTKAVGDALPMYIDAVKLQEMRACHFDPDAPFLDTSKFIQASTPFIGKPDGVPVILFVDPNCPHCREYFPVFMRVVEKYKDRMKFTVLPRPLWDESMPQSEALILAQRSGRYFDLWQRMLERASGKTGAMTEAEIAALFRELGLNTDNLHARLEVQKDVVWSVGQNASDAGVTAVPAVYINRRKVWGMNRSEECIGRMIEKVVAFQALKASK